MFFPHIDTLYFSASPKNVKSFEVIRNALIEARNQGKKTFDGYELVGRWENYGIGYINSGGILINLATDEEMGDALPIFIRVPASIMLQYWHSLDYLLHQCGLDFDGFIQTRINRMDITVDTDECDVTPKWMRMVDCRSKSGSWVLMGGNEDEEKYTNYIQDIGFTGITRGSGNSETVYFRIYDKLEEMYRKKIPYALYIKILLEQGWKGWSYNFKTKTHEGRIWRFEWEFKRDKLKDLGLETVEQAFGRVQKIYEWLVYEWVTMRDDPSKRISLKRFWKKMQEVEFDIVGCEEIPERETNVDTNRLQKQMIGVLRRIAIERNMDMNEIIQYMGKVLVDNEDYLTEHKKKSSSLKTAVNDGL